MTAPVAPPPALVCGTRALCLALSLAGVVTSALDGAPLGAVAALGNVAMAAACGAILGVPLSALVIGVGRLVPRRLFVVGALVFAAALAAATFVFAPPRAPDLAPLLLELAWLPLTAALWGVAWRYFTGRFPSRPALEALGVVASVGFAARFAALPYGGTAGALGNPLTASAALFQRLSDVDRDGASAWFGGTDCAPFDPAIGPVASEIPGNGLDDNCLGGESIALAQALPDPGYAALPAGFPQSPNLLLVTIDALRADHLGFYGYRKPTSPRLDRLAARGVVFESAFSQGPGTFESLPSLFTSRYPYALDYSDIRTNPPRLAKENTMLAEALRSAGYRTEAVFACHLERSVDWGLCDGFDHCDTSLIRTREPRSITSDRVTRAALEILAARARSERPLFLWVHYFDPHSTYVPHRGFLGEHDGDDLGRYDGEISFTDHHAGKLLEKVLDGELARRTVVVLGSDHGEGFKSDHGFYRHGYGLTRELLHVPLVVWAPGLRPSRRRAPVANLDVMPTLLNLARVELLGVQGRSLLPALLGAPEDMERRVFSEKTFQGTGGAILKALTTSTHRLIYDHATGEGLLFDRARDPAERTNLAPSRPDLYEPLFRELTAFIERDTRPHYAEMRGNPTR